MSSPPNDVRMSERKVLSVQVRVEELVDEPGGLLGALAEGERMGG